MDLIERFVPFVPFPVHDEPVIEHGRITKAVWWQSIEAILTTWESCDGGSPDECELGVECIDVQGWWPQSDREHHTLWECVLAGKRDDSWYRDVRFSVMEHGLVSPFSVDVSLDWQGNLQAVGDFGDGHHRLAACIDLGYTHVPVHVCAGDCSHPYSGLSSPYDWRRYLEGNTP